MVRQQKEALTMLALKWYARGVLASAAALICSGIATFYSASNILFNVSQAWPYGVVRLALSTTATGFFYLITHQLDLKADACELRLKEMKKHEEHS